MFRETCEDLSGRDCNGGDEKVNARVKACRIHIVLHTKFNLTLWCGE